MPASIKCPVPRVGQEIPMANLWLSCHPVSSQIQIRAIPQAPSSAGQNQDGVLIIHSASTNIKNI